MASNDSSEAAKTGSQSSLSMRIIIGTIHKRWPNVQRISTDTLHKWLKSNSLGVHQKDTPSETNMQSEKKKIIVLDARPMEEFQVSHIEGATRVCPDASDMAQTITQITKNAAGPGELDVICYCSVGYRSTRYADALLSKMKDEAKMDAIHEVYNLEGSLFKWANEDRPLVDMSGLPTKKVHPYNGVWGNLLKSELRSYVPGSKC